MLRRIERQCPAVDVHGHRAHRAQIRAHGVCAAVHVQRVGVSAEVEHKRAVRNVGQIERVIAVATGDVTLFRPVPSKLIVSLPSLPWTARVSKFTKVMVDAALIVPAATPIVSSPVVPAIVRVSLPDVPPSTVIGTPTFVPIVTLSSPKPAEIEMLLTWLMSYWVTNAGRLPAPGSAPVPGTSCRGIDADRRSCCPSG